MIATEVINATIFGKSFILFNRTFTIFKYLQFFVYDKYYFNIIYKGTFTVFNTNSSYDSLEILYKYPDFYNL